MKVLIMMSLVHITYTYTALNLNFFGIFSKFSLKTDFRDQEQSISISGLRFESHKQGSLVFINLNSDFVGKGAPFTLHRLLVPGKESLSETSAVSLYVISSLEDTSSNYSISISNDS